MKEKFVNSSINFICKYQECNDLKMKQLKYGLEGIYGLLIKLTAVIIISIITGTYKETLLFLLFYTGIRTYSFGFHTKSSLACWITTITIYNIIPFIFKNILITDIVGYIIIGLAFISMILWAPADTPKRPLIRKEKRRKCKIISSMVVIMYAFLFYFNKNILIDNAIIYALIIQSILINPITYKITKTQFNNYKYYHKNN